VKFSYTLDKYYKKRIFQDFIKPHKIPVKNIYKYFFIIPSYAEKLYINQTLDSINQQDKKLLNDTLVIIVINNAQDASEPIKQNNYATYHKLINLNYRFEFIVIDCFSKQCALPKKTAGVGLARKIGMDYCIKFSEVDSLFFSLDADTLINSNYLKIIINEYNKAKFETAVINFKHQKNDDPKIQKAIIAYENLLKDIAQNIKNSGSPYGFVSIGSAIVCTMRAYVSIGGIPPKKATEDFYFLQKLAKYQAIYNINDILVYPSSRAEQRVYLGTGFRMKNIEKNILFDDLYIKPKAYKNLQILYRTIESKWNCDSKEIMSCLVKNNSKLYQYLEINNFTRVFESIQKNSIDKKQLLNQFHRWFDNLKIYKFLKLYGN